MKKLAMKMLSLLLVLSLLLPTCVFAQPGQDGDGTPGTQGAAMEDADAPTGGGNGEDVDVPTGGGNGDGDADTPAGGGNGDGDADAPTGGGNGDGDTKDVNGGSVTQSTTSEKTTTFTEGEDGDEDVDVSEEEAAPTVVEMEEVVLDLSDMDLPDNEELFAAYVEREFDRAAGGMQYPVFYSSSHATRPLNDTEKKIYDALKTEIGKIAAGTVHDTRINVTITWTAAELGGTDFTETTTRNNFKTAAGDWNIENVSKALLADCAYELYWYDKTQGVSVPGYTIAPPTSGVTATQSYTVKFYVAKAYSAAGIVKTYETRSDLSAVSAAVIKAGNIVDTYKGKSVDEKLDGYFTEIRTLVDYNYDALAAGTLYGDPWQMIYVFDNDPTTKVVCEGYAKAFQYLCEKSTPQIKCYNVTGTMDGGNHMWNVVEQGGTRYLVDVTNCDDGEKDGSTLYGCGYMANPRDCYLYMKTVTPSTDGKTHTFTFHNDFLNKDYTVTYVYQDSMKDLFCEGYPKLGAEVKHTVTINKGANMTVTSGSLTQDVLDTAPMTEVILTAADGYYFPTSYSVSGGSGVTVTRLSYRQIKVSGTPTAGATINLAAPAAKGASSATAPTAKTLTYNGMAQELINAGSGSGGTIKYSTDGTTWYENAADIKGTDAVGYTVHYKVFGDETHNDTMESTIIVSIGKKIPEASDFVFAPPSSLGYDGNDKAATVTLKSPYSDAGNGITIKYAKSGTTVTNPKDVGEYTVSIDYKGGTNFESKSSGLTDSAWKFTIVPGVSSITINENLDKIYDGSAVTDPTVDKTGSGGAVSYTYYTNEGCTTVTTAANSGAASNGKAPKNAGDYWVKATVAADSNYGSATSDAKKFTISQKALTDSMITLGTQATYDGSAHGPVYSVKDGTTVLNKGTDYIETSGFNPLTNVGNMTLGISGAGNYTGEASTVWSLQRATPTAGDFDIPGLGTGYDYNGNPWSVNAPTLKSPKTGAGEVTVYYEGTSGTTYTKSTAAPTDVGSYSVTFNVAEGQNFKAASGLSIDTLKINKVNYTPPAVSDTVRSNQTTTDKTLALPALPAGASYAASGTVGGTAGLISSHSVSGTTLTYSTTNQTDGISATITIPVTGATNYNNYYVVVTVIAKDKDDAGVSITNGSSASVTYGETITISATTTASENGTWTWNYDTTVFDVVGANSERPSP